MTPVNVNKDGAADDGGMAERDNVGLDVERITGGLASDTLRGGPGPDTLDGRPGDDNLDGLAGDDTVAGGDGEDTLRGGEGRDTLVGGPERDVVAYSTEADVAVSLDTGKARTSQPGDRDRIRQVEDVRGGSQRDTLTGTKKANTLESSGGEDYLDGEAGRDRLDGGRRADVVAARDGARDAPVSCGPGADFAIVDGGDPVVRRGNNRCELVDDGTQTEPRPGQVYVDAPKRCGGSEDDVELGLPAMHRLVPLRYSIMLPIGDQGRREPTLDVSACPVRLTATPGEGRSASAEVSGAAVSAGQTSGRRVTTMLTVKSPSCAAGARRAGAAPRSRRLRLTTRGRRGRWRVLGRYSTGASFGTAWTTVEACSRTTTVVHRGRVQVLNLITRRTVIVRAGHQYVSQAR